MVLIWSETRLLSALNRARNAATAAAEAGSEGRAFLTTGGIDLELPELDGVRPAVGAAIREDTLLFRIGEARDDDLDVASSTDAVEPFGV